MFLFSILGMVAGSSEENQGVKTGNSERLTHVQKPNSDASCGALMLMRAFSLNFCS